MTMHLIVTCEHGGNQIPQRYRHLFQSALDVVDSHRGWDLGALKVAREIAASLEAPLYYSETTRLLIDLNRSLGQPDLYSEWSKDLTTLQREEIASKYYLPYRQNVIKAIRAAISQGPVTHLSVHSFTPMWHGVTRETDIGLLFDPDRTRETKFCLRWRHELQELMSTYQIDFNKPYSGVADGLTTALRRSFRDFEYTGIELEVNQKHLSEQHESVLLVQHIVQSLNSALFR